MCTPSVPVCERELDVGSQRCRGAQHLVVGIPPALLENLVGMCVVDVFGVHLLEREPAPHGGKGLFGVGVCRCPNDGEHGADDRHRYAYRDHEGGDFV